MANGNEINSRYSGPRRLHDDAKKALRLLAKHLTLQHSECESHSVLLIENLEGEECLEATAIYLVSAIAQSIETNLTLREALFDEEHFERELSADVVAVVGKDNSDENFGTMVRNPWMWEGISHMLIHLSRDVPGFHPSGFVLAKTSIKYDVHDHGLYMISIYEANPLGISAGECKAYLVAPTRAIVDASRILSELDSNKRDIEIRATVNQLRSSLKRKTQGQLASCFWKDERSYLPFVCCDKAHSPDWNRKRNSLRQLAIPVSRKFLIPVAVPNAREVFDAICNLMRDYAAMEES
ncbi:hypothetical protein [Symmachiella dynata]|uniref:hypothetical protein n=1 Tax=Symmachiella dynata TaxID=2527995 RepID=UPI0030EE2FB4